MLKVEKLRNEILKSLRNKKDPFQVLGDYDGISKSDVLEEANFLSREGYIANNAYADDTIFRWGHVTEKGEKYLSSNTISAKLYKIFNKIVDLIKLIK